MVVELGVVRKHVDHPGLGRVREFLCFVVEPPHLDIADSDEPVRGRGDHGNTAY